MSLFRVVVVRGAQQLAEDKLRDVQVVVFGAPVDRQALSVVAHADPIPVAGHVHPDLGNRVVNHTLIHRVDQQLVTDLVKSTHQGDLGQNEARSFSLRVFACAPLFGVLSFDAPDVRIRTLQDVFDMRQAFVT
eukprot:7729597-Pyramimonas_sp.AAC.1